MIDFIGWFRTRAALPGLVLCLALFQAPLPAGANTGGFLTDEEIAGMDVAGMIPSAPIPGSLEDHKDVAWFQATRPLLNTPRGCEAAQDDVYLAPEVWRRFAQPVGLPVNVAPESLAHLFGLVARAQKDAEFLLAPVKRNVEAGGRPRPFVRFSGTPTCLEPVDLVPGHRETDYRFHLKESGSYPSTHALLGALWGLTLAELLPEKAGEAVERGVEFGESRAVCGFHFASDIKQGRIVARKLFQRLSRNPDFQAELARAQEEIRALQGRVSGTPGAP